MLVGKAKVRVQIWVGAIGLALATLSWAQAPSELAIDDSTFGCIREMTPVRGFFVDNLIEGQLQATVKAAETKEGAVYPPGSVVQLVPGEAMVKHPKGFNAATKDWEFFELAVTPDNTTISKRGFVDVENKFGGNCFACHAKAKPQWDMICETGHGCDPLPIGKDMFVLIQKTDPRCKDNPKLTDEEIQKLIKLKQAMQAQIKDS